MMKIAIPYSEGSLATHFGHCDEFVIIDVDTKTQKINSTNKIMPPPHEPGLLPKWLASLDINIIIAGGIGQRAIQLFDNYGIKVLTGAPKKHAEQLVKDYLNGTLKNGENVCQH